MPCSARQAFQGEIVTSQMFLNLNARNSSCSSVRLVSYLFLVDGFNLLVPFVLTLAIAFMNSSVGLSGLNPYRNFFL